MTTEFRNISLEQISFADRARALDQSWVDALAAMIRTQGMIQPITVRHVGEGYRLVSGMHRFMAFRQLGADEIPCMVSDEMTDDGARLDEVMENLGRQELKALDRCRHLYELKKVWERMYPETAHGKASPKTQKMRLSPDAPEIFGFARETAAKIGLSKRAIEQDVSIWKHLSEASRRNLVGMKMAEKMTELKALSEEKHPRQAQILELIKSGEHPDIQNVAEAVIYLEGSAVDLAIEKQIRVARAAFGRLPDAALDMIMSAEADRVIASLKRIGRI